MSDPETTASLTPEEHDRCLAACARGDVLTPEEVALLARRVADTWVAWHPQAVAALTAMLATLRAQDEEIGRLRGEAEEAGRPGTCWRASYD